MNALKNPASVERAARSITCDGVCRGIAVIGKDKWLAEANDGIREFTNKLRHICMTYV